MVRESIVREKIEGVEIEEGGLNSCNQIIFLLVNNYPDPMYSADSAFLQRITEMASLEVETIKFEKSKKLRRKWKNENNFIISLLKKL